MPLMSTQTRFILTLSAVLLSASSSSAQRDERPLSPLLVRRFIEALEPKPPKVSPRLYWPYAGSSQYFVRRPMGQFFHQLLQASLQDRQKQEALQEAVLPAVSLSEQQGREAAHSEQDTVMGETLGLSVSSGGEESTGGDYGAMGVRAAMLRDRPGRSCNSLAQCRRKVDSSLNLLMRMMETGKRRK